jgi:hypothetical protein
MGSASVKKERRIIKEDQNYKETIKTGAEE